MDSCVGDITQEPRGGVVRDQCRRGDPGERLDRGGLVVTLEELFGGADQTPADRGQVGEGSGPSPDLL